MLLRVPDELQFVDRFYFFDCIDSTNDFAKTLHPLPLRGIYVIQAAVQNRGRGRYHKSFFSSTLGGLWTSLIIPLEDIASHFIHNRAISTAICSVLLNLYPESKIRIKWPNDIYWNERKLAGILLEPSAVSGKHLIVGFGLNVNIPIEKFPPELKDKVTSVQNETLKETPLTPLLNAILITYNQFLQADHQIEELYSSLLYKTGSPVCINNTKGIFSGVRSDGQIEITTNNGIVYFNSGTLEFL